jgi:hypothetical protein
MINYPENRWEWPLLTSIEEYLTARNEAERVATQFAVLRAAIERFASALRDDPRQVAHKVPDWPSRDDLFKLIQSAVTAWQKMENAYQTVPSEHKRDIPAPFKTLGDIGQIID